MSDSEFKEKVATNTSGKIKAVGKYQGSREKVLVECVECGHKWKVVASRISSKYRCPSCSHREGGLKRRVGEAQAKKNISEWGAGDYEIEGKFTLTKEPIVMRHIKCGRTYKTTYSDFKSGYRCPRCAVTYSPSTEEFKEQVFDMFGEEFEVLGDYVNNKTKIELKHNVCGMKFSTRPNDFLSRRSCTICSSSNGEQEVRRALDKLGVTYRTEETISGRLRADFYLPEYETYIEFDGIQHYHPIEFWGGADALKEQQKRDFKKDLYAKFLGRRLIRIPYWKAEDISVIIEVEILKLKQEEND